MKTYVSLRFSCRILDGSILVHAGEGLISGYH